MKQLSPTIRIKNIATYTPSDFDDDFKCLRGKKNIIYIISFNNIITPEYDVAKGKDYKLAPVSNAIRCKTVLYVGKSIEKPFDRLREHVGFVPEKTKKKTGALYLKDWWSHNVELVFEIYELDKSADIKHIEKLLWDSHSPLLGQRG